MLAVLILLTACGSSGDGDTNAGGDQSTVGSGFIAAAPVDGAICELFKVNNGSIGDFIARSAKSVDGSVSFSNVDYVGKAVIECSAGKYIDEATGVNKTSPVLRSALNFSHDGSFAVTPLTEIAYQLDDNINNVINAHNQTVAKAFGLEGKNIAKTQPSNINQNNLMDNDSGNYALVLAMLSQLELENNAEGNSLAGIMTSLRNDLIFGSLDTSTINQLKAAFDQLQNNSKINTRLNNAAIGRIRNDLQVIDQGTPALDAQQPNSPKLLDASSADATTASLSWNVSNDAQTALADIKYDIHLSNSASFFISSANQAKTVKGVSSTLLSGLTASSSYFVKLVAIDEDGNTAVSNEMKFTTSAIAAERTSATVNQSDAMGIDNGGITGNNEITYNNPTQAVEVGQIVISTDNGGFLRKVNSVSSTGGNVVASTEPARLTDVFKQFSFSSSNIIATPKDSSSQSRMLKSYSVNSANKVEVSSRRDWRQTGFSLIDASVYQPSKKFTSSTFSSASSNASSRKATAQVQSKINLQDQNNSVTDGDKLRITGAKVITMNPGDNLRLRLLAELTRDSKKNEVILESFVVDEFKHDEINDSNNAYYGATWINTPSKRADGRVNKDILNFYWIPKASHVSNKPYELTVKTTEKFDDGRDGKLRYTVYIYVSNESTDVANNQDRSFAKTSADGNITFESNLGIGFEPKIETTGAFDSSGLNKASVIATGRLILNQEIIIKALDNATLNGQTDNLIDKKFIKVIPTAAGVPVVVTGHFTLHAEYSSSADAALQLTHDFEASYEVEVGVDYDAGRAEKWQTHKTTNPIYSYALTGDANAKATGELRLVPRLRVSLYETAYGDLKIEPYLNAAVALEGRFVYTPDTNIDQGTDYRFTELSVKGGVDVGLHLGLDILKGDDEVAIGYPSTQQDDYGIFKPIDNKAIFALPQIAAISQHPVSDYQDSRIIRLSSTITDIQGFLGGESLNPFERNSIVWSDRGEGTSIIDFASDRSSTYLHYTQAVNNVFQARIAGNSRLGTFVRQYETTDIDLRDGNANNIPDYWENQYPDSDDDGLDYINEFKHGTFPNNNDSDNDGMPDGWEVTYNLNPQANDASIDTDNDGVNNLAEYQAGTNPNPEADATLSNLSISGVNLTPVFTASQNNYTATVVSTVTSTTVTPVASVNTVTSITVNGTVLASGIASSALPLNIGENTIIVVVTAADGVSTETYTLLITRVTLAAPQNLATAAGDEQVTISWSPVDNASSYNLYYAAQSLDGLVPDNYPTVAGVKLENISSPHVQTGLTNDQRYFFVVTATSSGIESAVSNEASATPTKPLPSSGKLNDTGITRCVDVSSNNLNCPVSSAPEQDAQHGRDAQAAENPSTLVKVGAGNAGFDFSKLDVNGDPLAASASVWSCVKDNHTGLVWEVKTDDNGIRDKDNRYTWYSATSNGGNAGAADSNASSIDNTTAFVTAVNTGNGLCGATDWRMPTRQDLRSIVNHSHATFINTAKTIDTNYFLNTIASGRYWSSSSNARFSSNAWGVDFDDGQDGSDNKANNNYVRLVRVGQ